VKPVKENEMKLLDRYIHEVGRNLPRKNRSDIQAELRSSVVDSLEDRYGPEPNETQIAEMLKELGPPKNVAASYYPEGQYLIGPSYYPLFRLIIWIVLASVVGAQILALIVAGVFVGDPISPLDALAGLLNSIPSSLGWVVLVFLILQRFEVHPDSEGEDWDPNSLPLLEPEDDLKRWELIVGLVFSILILVLVVFFPHWIGFVTTPGGKFYPNPVIIQYLGWVIVSLLAGVGLDIYLLRQGRWELSTRIAKIAVNILNTVVLFLLYQGHTTWLMERGASSFIYGVKQLPVLLDQGWELIGMHVFRLAFGIALVVTVVETIMALYRLVRSTIRPSVALVGDNPKEV
jgi:hypothetical protein